MKGALLTGAFLASCVIISEATFIIPTLAIGGGALAGLAVLKLAAIKGAVIGSLLTRNAGRRRGRGRGHNHYRYRYRRSLESSDLESVLLSASQQDSSDCAKKLVCEVSALPIEKLASEEALIAALFNPESLDLSKASVEFDLAAQIGKRVGIKQCSVIYERCPHKREKLISIFNNPKFGNQF